MPEAHLYQGALAHLGLYARSQPVRGEAGVAMAEQPYRAQLALRGEGGDAAFFDRAREALGFSLPTQPNRASGNDATTALWLGPSEWLLVTRVDGDSLVAALERALAGVHHGLTDVSESRVVIALSGPRARDLLAKATSLDLHPRNFQPGNCAQSTLARTSMLLHQLGEDKADGAAYEIYVHRSFAEYAWRWLEAAATEYGCAVITTP